MTLDGNGCQRWERLCTQETHQEKHHGNAKHAQKVSAEKPKPVVISKKSNEQKTIRLVPAISVVLRGTVHSMLHSYSIIIGLSCIPLRCVRTKEPERGWNGFFHTVVVGAIVRWNGGKSVL